MEYEDEHQEAGPRYLPHEKIEHMGLHRGLSSLWVLHEDMFMRQQAFNIQLALRRASSSSLSYLRATGPISDLRES